MKYKLQEVIRFGADLVQTEDLDPVYVALVKAKLPKGQLYRLLLAYFCFYHLGVSAFLSEQEGDTFWDIMEIAARNRLCDPNDINFDLPEGKWPRGAERRHFRGDKCVKAVQDLRALSKDKGDIPGHYPEHIVGLLFDISKMVTLEGLMKSVQVYPLFGPWIAFKIADTLERVLDAPIEFPNDLTLMYKEPRAALDMLDVTPEYANERLLTFFGKNSAPPRYERKCNIQEVETILCKWKSSKGGHYYVGKDIHEIRTGLKGWGKTADKLLAVMPKEVVTTGGLFA
jgi:hypothetical protein